MSDRGWPTGDRPPRRVGGLWCCERGVVGEKKTGLAGCLFRIKSKRNLVWEFSQSRKFLKYENSQKREKKNKKEEKKSSPSPVHPTTRSPAPTLTAFSPNFSWSELFPTILLSFLFTFFFLFPINLFQLPLFQNSLIQPDNGDAAPMLCVPWADEGNCENVALPSFRLSWLPWAVDC